MHFTVNIDFQGLCAFVPINNGKAISVLMVSTRGMHRHHPRLFVQNECLDDGDISLFTSLEPSATGFLTSSCEFSRCTATIGSGPGSISSCRRGIVDQNYPDEHDGDDSFWIPSFADFSTSFAVRAEALRRAPNRYVVSRVDVMAGNFVSLNHITSRGRFSRFTFTNPSGGKGKCEKAFSDCVRLTVEATHPKFAIPIVRRHGSTTRRHNLKISPGADDTAWMAFVNLPERPTTDKSSMTHMPLYKKLLKPPVPTIKYPEIDSTKPTFGDTQTWRAEFFNSHTSTCPSVRLASPDSSKVAFDNEMGQRRGRNGEK